MSETLGFGLIGAGQMGRIHARNLASGRVAGASLVAVSDVLRDAAENCASENSVSAVYQRPEDLLAHPGLAAVVIATPGNTHGPIIEQATDAGKHVFVEKPLETSLERLDRALAAVRKARVQLQVGFNRRFDAGFGQAAGALRAGRAGRTYVLHIISRDPVWRVPPSFDGLFGLLFDTTIHDFDMARYLAGEVESLYALGAPLVHEAGVPDTLVVTLRFAGGALGTIENGQAVSGYDQRLELFGSKGIISVGNEYPHAVRVADEAGEHAPPPLPFYAQRYAASYVAELEAFVRAVQTAGEPEVTGADGRAATVLALAAQGSLDEQRPVFIEEIG